MLRPKSAYFWLLIGIAVLSAVFLTRALRPQPLPPLPPACSFECLYDGNVAVDIGFSPDNRRLAVVSADSHSRGYSTQTTFIYDVGTRTRQHEIGGGAWRCAWNAQGTQFATSTWNGFDVDVWNCKSWRRERRLTLGLSPRDQRIIDFMPPANLRFSQTGSLYLGLRYSGYDGYFPMLLRAEVWWSTSSIAQAESIGSCAVGPFDLSIAALGPDTRVVVSNEDADCTLEVMRVQDSGGKHFVKSEYHLSAAQAHGLRRAEICLSGSGQYLAARDDTQVCLFEVFDDHLALLSAQQDKEATTRSTAGVRRVDLSLDGRFAAYGSEHRIRIVRVPSGELVLDVNEEPACFALSTDGRLLALASPERKSILFFDIPQGSGAALAQ
jgi:WD40 repeat protein